MKDFKLAFFLALKSITRGDKGSLIMIIAIMTVVFLNLLFTDAIFAGIAKGINDVKIDYQYGEIIIEPKIGEKFISESTQIVDFLKDQQYVTNINSNLQKGVTFINEKNKDGRDDEKISSILMGLDVSQNQSQVFDIQSKIIAGRFLKKNDVGKIVLGSGLSGGYGSSVFPDDLGKVKVGSKIKVDFQDIIREYEVIGIYQTKNFDTDRRGLVLKKELKSILGTTNESSEIILRLDSRKNSKKIAQIIKESKFKDYEISDWQKKIAFGAGIEKSFNLIGTILRFIGALVTGLVIFIIIFIDIVNKRRQIGILKAIGIHDHIIILSYIFRGLFYVFLGSVLGYFFMNFIVEIFQKYPINMPMADVVPFVKNEALASSIIFFIVAGFVGSFLPAFKEIRKNVLSLLYR